MLTPFDSLAHLLLQQLFEGLLGLLFRVPLVSFLLKFWPFFLRDFNAEGKGRCYWINLAVYVCTRGDVIH